MHVANQSILLSADASRRHKALKELCDALSSGNTNTIPVRYFCQRVEWIANQLEAGQIASKSDLLDQVANLASDYGRFGYFNDQIQLLQAEAAKWGG